ncbi:hypothetical protein [Polynucleobacter necessarius]|uniref:hypothetical protein n=1 Tax=Polynucleobacter necessarius TaxID=576610 RepID=UPI0013B06815|nr:hypothetical protein [Polynucleobacter necessarius]
MNALAPPVLIFITAFIFSLGVTFDLEIYVFMSMLYVLLVTSVSSYLIYKSLKNSIHIAPSYIALMTICNHSGMLLGFLMAGGADSMIWAADAMDHHLPNAIAFSDWMAGEGQLEIFNENPFKTIYISNIWVGLFFYFMGANPLATGLAMMLIKIVTIFIIYRAAMELTNDACTSSVAGIIYALSPTITFYTIQFYKDFFIQLLVSLILLSIFKYRNKIKTLLIIPITILIFERFYLSIMISITFLVYFFLTAKGVIKKILMQVFCIILSFIIFRYYFRGQEIYDLFNIIQNFADTHNDSADVTPTTNIFIDLFRILFTPFFNFHKLEAYNKFDSLLIWGSFVHQVVMLFYIKGIWIYRKNSLTIVNLAFIFLILILALIVPYNGRARDSFYPLIVIYSAIGIASLFKRNK